MYKTVLIVTSIALAFALFFAYTNSALVFAQNQSSSSSSNKTTPENQTSATVTGKAQTAIVNKTSIPAEQTTVKTSTITKPGQSLIKPLSNQTLQQTPSLSGIQNKTIVQATGPATTTIVNKTTVPYNQTVIGAANTSKAVAQSSSSPSSQNSSSSTPSK